MQGMTEQLARVHWWYRHRQELIARYPEILEGVEVAEIDEAWTKVRDTEVQAMIAALRTVTLYDVTGAHNTASPDPDTKNA